MNERQYKDVAGNPCTLRWLVKNEPEWAENQIRHRDTLERELADASRVIAALTEKLDRANARIARLEEAGDDLRVCCESVVSGSEVAKSVKRWTEAKETKP